MNDPSIENELFDEVAESFVQRLRQGEHPPLSEYTAKHPELAEHIRKLFPALVMMEKAGSLEGETPGAAVQAARIDAARIPARLGEYRILREIGRGGMGIVYEAVQESLGRHVALKVFPFHSLLSPTHLERFQREARAAARLHHTNIVPVFGVGEHERIHYYAMQFILGQGLDEVLREVRRLRGNKLGRSGGADRPPSGLAESVAQSLVSGDFSGSGLPVNSVPASTAPAPPHTAVPSHLTSKPEGLYFGAVAQIGLQVAEALEYAHGQGILHRDIKPSNLLLDTTGRVWITDFGLAKAEDADDLTSPGDIVGTVAYMAPERFHGKADPRSDVYGVGITLYEMLTLRPAFEDRNRAKLIERVSRAEPVQPAKIDPQVPRDLETIVLKAIAKEPADRYRTPLELAEDLARLLADRPIRSRRSSWSERAWRLCRRNPVVTSLTASSVVLLLAIALVSTFMAVRLDKEASRARQAERDANERLFKASYAQAQASRWSGRPGQRFQSLAALGEAASLLPCLDAVERPKQLAELRNEAIACLALADVRAVSEWEGFPAGTSSITFDARFEHYARSDSRGTISTFRVGGGEELVKFPGSGVATESLKFSPDGRFLAAFYASHEVRLWELATQKNVLQVTGVGIHAALDWALDGRLLALGFSDGTIAFYEPPFTRPVRRLKPGFPVDFVALPSDGSQVAIANWHGHGVIVLDALTGELQGRFEHPDLIEAIGCAHDGRYLATGCRDGAIYVWDINGAQPPLVLKGHQLGIAGVAFNGRGDLLASTAWDGTLRLWNPTAAKLLVSIPAMALSPQFSRDDRLLASVAGSTVRLLEMAPEREYRVFAVHQASGRGGSGVLMGGGGNGTFGSDFSPDNRILASAGADGVRLWDVASGKELARLIEGQHETVLFRPGGSHLVTWGDTNLYLWPIHADAQPHREKPAPPGQLTIGPPELLYEAAQQSTNRRACWSPDGRLLALCDPGSNRTVLLDVDQRRTLLCLQAQPGGCIDLSRDGKWIATGPHPGFHVEVWNAENGQLAATLPVDQARVAFSPDSEWLVTGTPREYSAWRVGSWELVRRLRRSSAVWLGRMAFSADGRLLAVADSDRSVQLLDARAFAPVATLTAPDLRLITHLRFNAAGDRLAAATESGPIQLWDLGRIRHELAALDLHWDLPTYAPVPAPAKAAPLQVRVLRGSLQRRWEAEDLAVVERVDCDIARQDMAAYDRSRWSRGRQLFATAWRAGAYFTLEFELAKSGPYDLQISFTRSWDYGEVQVSLDGKEIGQRFDGYDPHVNPSGKIKFGTHNLSEGAHRVRFTAVGKHPKSSSYRMGVDCLDLRPIK
jgi:eukaryotic-like serine/threonine-protein kinase